MELHSRLKNAYCALLFDTDKKAICRDWIDFANFYNTGINGHKLFTKIGDCRMLLVTGLKINQKPFVFLAFIVYFADDVFPNLQISLQILFAIPVSIASCQRSFSKLKLTLSYSRASMEQDRFSNLAFLSVERETWKKRFWWRDGPVCDSEIKKNKFMVDYVNHLWQ